VGVLAVDSDGFINANNITFRKNSGFEIGILRVSNNEFSTVILRNVQISASNCMNALFFLFNSKNIFIQKVSISDNFGKFIESSNSISLWQEIEVKNNDCSNIQSAGCLAHLSKKSEIAFVNVKIESITHQMEGGVIYSQDSNLLIKIMNLIGVPAKYPGGCVMTTNSNISVEFASFIIENQGCFHLTSSSVVFGNSSIFRRNLTSQSFEQLVALSSSFSCKECKSVYISYSNFSGGHLECDSGAVIITMKFFC
jgi:hypothetical protein